MFSNKGSSVYALSRYPVQKAKREERRRRSKNIKKWKGEEKIENGRTAAVRERERERERERDFALFRNLGSHRSSLVGSSAG